MIGMQIKMGKCSDFVIKVLQTGVNGFVDVHGGKHNCSDLQIHDKHQRVVVFDLLHRSLRRQRILDDAELGKDKERDQIHWFAYDFYTIITVPAEKTEGGRRKAQKCCAVASGNA